MERAWETFPSGQGQTVLSIHLDEGGYLTVSLLRNRSISRSIAFASTYGERTPLRVRVLGDSLIAGGAFFTADAAPMHRIIDWLRDKGGTVDIHEDAEVAA